MGLFGDTLRDARRPIAGAWVRRFPAETAERAPEPDQVSGDLPDTGMQTVFRFQKAESPAGTPGGLREASPRPSVGMPAAPAADPLSAGAEVGTPEPLAQNVIGNEGISDFLEVSRRSELETGQVRHGSPGKMAAANAKSESGASRSEVLPGRFETEPYRETHQSTIPEGSERLVSRDGETSESRPSGRGASPSETYPTTAVEPAPADRPIRVAAPPTPFGEDDGTMPGRLAAAEAIDRAGPARGNGPDAAGAPASRHGLIGAEPGHPAAERPAQPGRDAPRPQAERHAAPPARERGRAPEPAPPGLVIGRIDVVVVADAPAKPQPAARPDSGYLSRHYLKRL